MFDSRSQAGRRLARTLLRYASQRPVVLALVPGGVSVGVHVAALLSAELDVLVVHELPLAVIVEGVCPELDLDVCRAHGLTLDEALGLVVREQAEIERQVRLLRGLRPMARVAGRDVILVDDGSASSRKLDAAIRLVRMAGARQLILAMPTAPVDLGDGVAGIVDEVVTLEPGPAIGEAYVQREPLGDRDLLVQLNRARLAM